MMKMIIVLTALVLLCAPAHAQQQTAETWTCWKIGAASIAVGSGYAPGKRDNVALAGGAGSGARADITVGPAGSVIDVKFTDPGVFYIVGDVLTTDLGAGSGFSLTVKSVMDFHPDLQTKRGKSTAGLTELVANSPCPRLNDAQ